MSIQKLFPTLVLFEPLAGTPVLKKLSSDLIDDVNHLMEIDEEGFRWSQKNYIGGYTSYNSICNLHKRSSSFAKLEQLVNKKVSQLEKSLEWDLMDGKLEMTSCWVNVMPPMAHHSFHLHPLSAISGTFYLQVPRGSGSLKLEDPRSGLLMGSPPKKANAKKAHQPIFEIKPKEGHVVLFESWLRHEVPANTSEEPRVSISFNYEWR